MIVDPWGRVLAAAPRRGVVVVADLDLDAQERGARASCPSLANRRPGAYRWPEPAGACAVSARGATAAVDKRRLILDAAIRVFAREGFHRCRVSDIAKEANVAYGLVYHYFRSKDEVLDTLFTERWSLLLDAIAEIDESDVPAREKLHAIAVVHHRLLPARPRPDEGDHRRGDARGEHVRPRAPRPRSGRPTTAIAAIFAKAQEDGTFRTDISPEFATLCFYGAIEQLLTAWIFEEIVRSPEEFEQAKQMIVETVCGGLEVRSQVPGVTT